MNLPKLDTSTDSLLLYFSGGLAIVMLITGTISSGGWVTKLLFGGLLLVMVTSWYQLHKS